MVALALQTHSKLARWVPSQAFRQTKARQLADERMGANKSSRSSASRHVVDALLQVIRVLGGAKTSSRHYSDSLSRPAALEELKPCNGSQFDPRHWIERGIRARRVAQASRCT